MLRNLLLNHHRPSNRKDCKPHCSTRRDPVSQPRPRQTAGLPEAVCQLDPEACEVLMILVYLWRSADAPRKNFPKGKKEYSGGNQNDLKLRFVGFSRGTDRFLSTLLFADDCCFHNVCLLLFLPPSCSWPPRITAVNRTRKMFVQQVVITDNTQSL